MVHDINACSPEEMEDLGGGSVSGSIAVGEYYPSDDAITEPDYGDGGPVILPRPETICEDVAKPLVPITPDLEDDYQTIEPMPMEPTPVQEPGTVSIINVSPPVEECDSGREVQVMPIFVPGFIGEEPTYQSELDALDVDCTLAGGTMWVSSNGEAGCTYPPGRRNRQ